ncbi:histone deacetylase HDT1-like [Oncorhynchus kisutch]|uniref:histone deacetylase HDT1-like n=1 Tax=Oncorhynchus kisutch TaxID=8019 RepID=UPI0012DEAE59|nr:histone deacetylase HDT1-like [Oncorhynchus kisutch]
MMFFINSALFLMLVATTVAQTGVPQLRYSVDQWTISVEIPQTYDSDELQTYDSDELQTYDSDELQTYDSDELQTDDSDELQTDDSDELQTDDSDELQTDDSDELQTDDSDELQTDDSDELQTDDSDELQTDDSDELQTDDSDETPGVEEQGQLKVCPVWLLLLVVPLVLLTAMGALSVGYYMCVWRGGRIGYWPSRDLLTKC